MARVTAVFALETLCSKSENLFTTHIAGGGYLEAYGLEFVGMRASFEI